jgi:hypothetical protein
VSERSAAHSPTLLVYQECVAKCDAGEFRLQAVATRRSFPPAHVVASAVSTATVWHARPLPTASAACLAVAPLSAIRFRCAAGRARGSIWISCCTSSAPRSTARSCPSLFEPAATAGGVATAERSSKQSTQLGSTTCASRRAKLVGGKSGLVFVGSRIARQCVVQHTASILTPDKSLSAKPDDAVMLQVAVQEGIVLIHRGHLKVVAGWGRGPCRCHWQPERGRRRFQLKRPAGITVDAPARSSVPVGCGAGCGRSVGGRQPAPPRPQQCARTPRAGRARQAASAPAGCRTQCQSVRTPL